MLGVSAIIVASGDRGVGGTPQTLNAAVTPLSIMVATTAMARLGENNNFNCARIMGNQHYCKPFH